MSIQDAMPESVVVQASASEAVENNNIFIWIDEWTKKKSKEFWTYVIFGGIIIILFYFLFKFLSERKSDAGAKISRWWKKRGFLGMLDDVADINEGVHTIILPLLGQFGINSKTLNLVSYYMKQIGDFIQAIHGSSKLIKWIRNRGWSGEEVDEF